MIDTESLWHDVYNDVLKEEYGVEISIKVFAKYAGVHGTGLHAHIYEITNGQYERERVREKLHKKFNERKFDLDLRYGVLDRINEAREYGLQTAIASSSSKEWIKTFLKKFNIEHLFVNVVGKEDVTNVKPDPELYLKTASALNLPHQNIVAIEDSITGSNSALNAGLNCIVVPNRLTKYCTFNEKIKVYDSFKDLNINDLLEELKNDSEINTMNM